MDPKKLETLTLEEKVDYLLQKIDKIDHTINPPWWKTMLLWCWNHLFLIIGLTILAYFTWKIWGVVQDVMLQTQIVKDQISGFQEQIKTLLNSLKFWQ